MMRCLVVFTCAVVMAQSPEERFRAELPTKAIEQPVKGGVRVAVRAGDGGPLAPAADVLVISTDDWTDTVSKEYRAAIEAAGDQWTMARHRMLLRFGRRWRTDAQGEAEVPANPMMWGAVSGDLWAFGPHWNDPTIVLRPRLRVPVRVLAADGSVAAHVPLCALQGAGHEVWVNAKHTDAAGAAVLEFDFDHVLYSKLTVGVAWPVPEPYVDFAPRERLASATQEPIVLRLPELARLVVASTQPDGKRRPLNGVSVQWPHAPQRASVSFWPDAAGEVVVVARPGQRLRADLWCRDQIYRHAVELPMPAKAGDCARTHLGEFTAGLARLRVLGVDGKPHVNGQVQVDYGRPVARCDAAGRLRWGLDGGPAGREHVLTAVADDGETTLGAVVVELPQPAARLVDLGDVRMQPEPILLRGRVVDGNGRAVPGAIVRFAGPANAFTDGLRARCDGQGAFVLRGLMPKIQQVGVWAHRPQDSKETAEGTFDVGASDVRLTLR